MTLAYTNPRKVVKFIDLDNGQIMKICYRLGFRTKEVGDLWYMSIVVGKTRRQCNDAVCKSDKSPKNILGKHTGRKLGLKPFVTALRDLLEFEKQIMYGEMCVISFNSELHKVYSRLLRYGYSPTSFGFGNNINEGYVKVIDRRHQYLSRGENVICK